MRKFNKYFFLALLLGVFSCSDDYFDVNTPSATADVEQLRINDLLAPVIFHTVEGQYSAELAFGNYVQNFAGQGGTAAGETTAAGLWADVYLYALPNIEVIKDKAADAGASHYAAIADILKAMNLGMATDTWDYIPMNEASMGVENLFPDFNAQEEVYTEVFSLLDAAIADLQGPDDSTVNIGREDLVYQGNIDQWIRAAYTIKARYQLHLVQKGVISPNEVLASLENGFTSNDDDFQIFYDDRSINPRYAQEVLARNTGNFHNVLASQIVSMMNGNYYPFESDALEIDPRLPVFGEIDNSEDTEWRGYVSGGGGVAPNGEPANVQFADGGYYTRVDAPIVVISYAEAQFIKAEAEFLANGGTATSTGTTPAGYEAYLEGIRASMAKYGVNGSDYLDDPVVDVGADNLMLHHIMKEKYIHNFLNPETFVDFRRYDFSEEVFTGLTIREEEDGTGDFEGEWFRRATYPSTEVNRNGEVVEQYQESPVTPVWWDAE
ncbi:SusD/RagB family nutrient-binding outer membrane lipoprotein [Christiangramia aestuarii]|uniref:SusD/RagB family nutrient-binding outer membrane lipoprotein n=1 Tax=Christiangramia aestuarii TaxID=1028746 RepID=A0A7M3SWY3_9FLAO|nr:SusD/RagB family nutrient-binding outer membrane lipoprotein [Christiangramia aestuarii]MUP41114.1 SusD/RagB family nutrient-binding outer membrane lipoprotein [Christiangramia aestuarii]